MNFASQPYGNCPWGNQDKTSCLKFGVDELVADSTALPASNGITISHLNMVSLVKNIEKLDDFLNEFSRKPEIICISETRTNNKNIHSVALPGYSCYSNNSSTKSGGVGIYVVGCFYCQKITNLRLRAGLHCAYKISKFFTLVRRGCLHYTKRRLRA